jgi:hypothetical protein
MSGQNRIGRAVFRSRQPLAWMLRCSCMPTKMGNVADGHSRPWQAKPSVLQPRKNFGSGLVATEQMISSPRIHMLSPITFLYLSKLRIQSEAAADRMPEVLDFSMAVEVDELPQAPEPGKRRVRPMTLIDIIKSKRLDPWAGEGQEPAGQLAG